MSDQRKLHQTSRCLAVGGLMTALSVVGMYLAGLIGVGTFAGPLFGGLLVLFTLEQCGGRTACAQWLASGILTVLLCTDKELALIYLLVTGWYPLLRWQLAKLPMAMRILCKLLLFNAATCAVYALLLFVMYGGDWSRLGFGGLWLTVCALLLGNVILFCYDWLLVRVRERIRKKFHR